MAWTGLDGLLDGQTNGADALGAASSLSGAERRSDVR